MDMDKLTNLHHAKGNALFEIEEFFSHMMLSYFVMALFASACYHYQAFASTTF
jgi:hypothetical protein